MKSRLPLIVLVVALLFIMILKSEIRTYRMAAKDPTAALSTVFSPGEQIAASLFGGFRSVLVNILWVRILRHWEKNQLLELPFLLKALEDLQGSSPTLYYTQAHMMILDIPNSFSEGDKRWEWIARGLMLLNRGLERFGTNAKLLEDAGNLYFARFGPGTKPADRERYMKDTVLNPSREDPVEIAEALLLRALELEDHRSQVDFLLKKIQVYNVEKLLQVDIGTLNEDSVRREVKERLRDSRLRKALVEILEESRLLVKHVWRVHTAEQKHEFFRDILRSWEKELELFQEEFLSSE